MKIAMSIGAVAVGITLVASVLFAQTQPAEDIKNLKNEGQIGKASGSVTNPPTVRAPMVDCTSVEAGAENCMEMQRSPAQVPVKSKRYVSVTHLL